jgi:septal ring factor EnvC (AmiA/AmiB activator)
MAEHRPVLDPSVLHRLSTSMESIAAAWEADVTELRRAETKLADTERLLNSASDRASTLQADLRTARAENKGLLLRNAHLEAQVHTLYETSLDARDAVINLLGGVASRAVQAAQTAPAIKHVGEEAPAAVSAHAEPKPKLEDLEEDDGTHFPRGRPQFLQSTDAPPALRRATLPPSPFVSRHVMAAE